MRKTTLFLVALGLVGHLSGQSESNRLKGAWQLFKYDYGGGKKPAGTKEVKLITDHYFVWTNYDAKGLVLAQGGGTYTLNGLALTEHLDYADRQDKFLLNNKDQVLTISFEADTLTSTGTLSNGQKITEIWKRIE